MEQEINISLLEKSEINIDEIINEENQKIKELNHDYPLYIFYNKNISTLSELKQTVFIN